MSIVFSYFASAAAGFHVHVSASSHLSLPRVYLRSVRSPLHLASWLTLFIALLSAFRADMYFILVFPAWDVVYSLLLHGRCFLLLCCCGLSRGHFNIFVFPAWEVLLFVCSLMVDVIHCIFITFYTTEFNPWYNSFSFSLCFYWHLVSFTITLLCSENFALLSPAF